MRKPVILIVALIAALLVGCKEDTAGPLRMGRRQFHLDDSTEYIAIIGDIQSMIHYPANRDYLKATAHWLVWQYALHPESLRAVILTGDITEDNSPEEWRIAGELLSDLAATVPVILTTGNHDYNTDEGRASTGINSIAPAGPARRAIVASFEEGRVENVVYRIRFGGRPLSVIVLEFGPRREVVEKARDYIAGHPDERFLLLTHELLTTDGEIVGDDDATAPKVWFNEKVATPAEIMRELVFPFDNVRATLCGHNGFCAHRFDLNVSGRSVCSVLFNLQSQTYGGDGWLMLWQTSDGTTVESVLFNAVSDHFCSDSFANFSFRL